ncbi:MAG: FdtA/QdtA family cupin domain-containing protein [Muribaculaceae bacterium]|nr:FdtA/QdtA family cupin domain-containing protein [Muribaculaceae bacterium]
MKDSKVYDCSIIQLRRHHSDRKGNLSVVSGGESVPFDIKRVYYIYDVPGGESRGSHAHKNLHQLIIAVSGSFTVTVGDGEVRRSFRLDRPYMALHIVPGIWRTLDEFSSGAVCMVLASDIYDPDDYIRDYNEYLQYKGRNCDAVTEND